MLVVVQNLSISILTAKGWVELHFPIGITILQNRLHIGSELAEELQVVIAKDKVERFVQRRDDELIVLQGKIASCDDYIDIGIPTGDILGVDQWIRFVGNAKYLHAHPAR